MNIRKAVAEDAQAIAELLNHYIENTTCTFYTEPMSVENRRDWIAAHTAKHPVFILELDGAFSGVCALSEYNVRPAYCHTVESMVYLRSGIQGRGYGTALMQRAIDDAKHLGHHAILAGICAEQIASIRLHQRLGFEKVAHYREVGKKFGRWLDVIYMELLLQSAKEA
ncbi:MAG TPA: GNAT family N-acetyltransferase [Opitutaceae bacterium]|nr:GNAT family N-acetyltransferase [Opitutaceae bacterium]